MKRKKFKGKLALNKISIASLDKFKIHEVKGGDVLFNVKDCPGTSVPISDNGISVVCKTECTPFCPIITNPC